MSTSIFSAAFYQPRSRQGIRRTARCGRLTTVPDEMLKNPLQTSAGRSTHHPLPTSLLRWLLVLLGLLTVWRETAFSVGITDDLGHEISLQEPAKRIIPLYGAFAEMLFAMGAGKEVVARTQADQFPPEIITLPSVGTHMRPNVEMIIGLKPDLVVQSASRWEATADMARLQSAGIRVAVFSPNTFEEIFSTMERLAILVGRPEQGLEVVSTLQKRLAAVRNRVQLMKERPKLFFEVRPEPLTAAGRGSIVQGIITAAGAENVIKSDKALLQYNFEALMVADPDVYIVQRGPMSHNPLPPGKRPHFDQLRSVRQGKVIFVDEYFYSRPGPRCVEAVEQLARALFPEKS
jgi:iron complex transport system substrate-binding protein